VLKISAKPSLPVWFIFGKKFGEYSLDMLLAFGKERIDVLLAFSSANITKENIDFHKKLENPLGLMALIVAAAVANDAYFMNWLLETEGDLFIALFNSSDLGSKIAILEAIFGELIIGAENIAQKMGISIEKLISEVQAVLSFLTRRHRSSITFDALMKSLTAARFIRAYKLIKFNRGIIIGGWVIAPLSEFFHFSKSYYQEMLRKRIQILQEKMKKSPNYEAYRAFGEELINYWRGKKVTIQRYTEKHSKIPTRGKLWEKTEFFPPCSRILYDQFIATGYLSHNERLQLGLFLKALGMPLEEQLKFWYNAVDNVGLSWEKFLKKGGYYIRHIYGLEGSRKDYRPPKCETIIAKYFCPFAKLNFSELKEKLRAINPKISASAFDKIQKYVISREPRKACAQFLMSMIRGMGFQYSISIISHPLQFVRILYRYARGGKYDSKRTPKNV